MLVLNSFNLFIFIIVSTMLLGCSTKVTNVTQLEISKSLNDQLLEASTTDDVEKVKSLINLGADIYYKDDTGRTAFMYATYHRHLNVMRYFIELGVDINATDNNGFRALNVISTRYGENIEVVQLLLDAGADVNSRTGNGFTALLNASKNGQLNVMKLLAKNGADLNCKSYENGYTPLYWASYNNRIDIITFLIESGAEVDMVDNDGNTALHYASLIGYLDVVKYLVNSGADIGLQNKKGKTAQDFAKSKKYHKVVKYLKSINAK